MTGKYDRVVSEEVPSRNDDSLLTRRSLAIFVCLVGEADLVGRFSLLSSTGDPGLYPKNVPRLMDVSRRSAMLLREGIRRMDGFLIEPLFTMLSRRLSRKCLSAFPLVFAVRLISSVALMTLKVTWAPSSSSSSISANCSFSMSAASGLERKKHGSVRFSERSLTRSESSGEGLVHTPIAHSRHANGPQLGPACSCHR